MYYRQTQLKTLFRLTSLLLIWLLAACSSVSDPLLAGVKQVDEKPKSYQPQSSEGSLHFHVERLARQLFDTANGFDVSRPMVVGTFLPAERYDNKNNAALVPYGIQIQESFATFATQAGLKVIEFKTLPAVKITNNADIMMSRDVNDLDSRVSADYMLTGSYTQQQNSLVVNVRLIRVFDKTIVAAATDYLPLNSMWSHNKVQIKDSRLYRGEY
ncbi:FlgO family outer membrane protein [Psychrosphaera sp. 1_MG-2023]|uniref:FlgO family outer membrane protein n=1 Tax=Psychrosphaera algicola TaxID=3023714 RepID=A0ABT5FIV9_9GAMM|nr:MULTISPECIES: FlgO family outer membrane protein [unclassified Psychrosphaera]MDC2891139.1 FlgO family outer membrane protein [Psychrosphaera sp. G1-22]MDO6718637.1 FlgO family outer membrane protein [Psychrosphaera sp. 1_MG-2023]